MLKGYNSASTLSDSDPLNFCKGYDDFALRLVSTDEWYAPVFTRLRLEAALLVEPPRQTAVAGSNLAIARSRVE